MAEGTNKNHIRKAAELKKNTEVVNSTFSKFGFKVLNIGIPEFNEFHRGTGIKFYVEVQAKRGAKIEGCYNLKINIYDNQDNLLSIGKEIIDMKKFAGVDTFLIYVLLSPQFFNRALKAKVYLTKV